MTVTLNIILDALSDMNIEHIALDTTRDFERVNVLQQDDKALHSDHLYVCRLSEALQLTRDNADVVFVCLRDRFNSIDETEELMKNIVVVNENMPVTKLFSVVYDVFIQVITWQYNMLEAFIKKKPIHELLILSEPIIKNFITISDSSLSLMSYTPNIPIDDPVSNALIANGYHSEDAIRRFKEHGRYQLWESTEGLLYDLEQITSSYPVVSKIFKYGGTYFTHVAMICNNRPISHGLIDLFNILLDHLAAYIDKDWQQRQDGSRVYDPMITHILDNAELPADVIADRIEQIGMPLDGSYCLFKLVPMKNPGQPAGIIAQTVQSLLPDMKIVVYHHALLLLICDTEGEIAAQIDKCRQQLSEIIEANGLCCGISPVFSDLTEIRQVFEYATLAIKYGRRLISFSPAEVFGGPFFNYEDYYFYMLLSEQDNMDILASGQPYQWLKMLRSYDADHRTDNFGLLYLYLTNERHAGNTAKAAFMSRNNLVYRINRIKEILNINLDDYHVRMSILITYEMLKLNPSSV